MVLRDYSTSKNVSYGLKHIGKYGTRQSIKIFLTVQAVNMGQGIFYIHRCIEITRCLQCDTSN